MGLQYFSESMLVLSLTRAAPFWNASSILIGWYWEILPARQEEMGVYKYPRNVSWNTYHNACHKMFSSTQANIHPGNLNVLSSLLEKPWVCNDQHWSGSWQAKAKSFNVAIFGDWKCEKCQSALVVFTALYLFVPFLVTSLHFRVIAATNNCGSWKFYSKLSSYSICWNFLWLIITWMTHV